MRLFLIQHGLSLPEEKDPEKPLSSEGREQTQKIAQFLKAKNISFDCMWHSTKLRAIQTAQIILDHVPCSEVKERNDLNPLDPVKGFTEEMTSLNRDLMVIGHLPFLQKLASLILSGSEDNPMISFKNSGVVCLEYVENWKVKWQVTPDLL